MVKMTDWNREGKAGEWQGNGGRKREGKEENGMKKGGKIWGKWE